MVNRIKFLFNHCDTLLNLVYYFSLRKMKSGLFVYKGMLIFIVTQILINKGNLVFNALGSKIVFLQQFLGKIDAFITFFS